MHSTDSIQKSHNYHILYERSPLGYQSLDANGHFIIVNPAWCELLGYSEDEVVGKWFGDFMTPASKQKVIDNFPKFKAEGKICGIEFDMLCKDGSQLNVSFDGRIGYDEQGQFNQTHCIIQDLTEKKKNKAIEESYGNIFENSLNEIFIFDAETYKFIKVNRGACANIGYTAEELRELTPMDLKTELTLEQFNELLAPLRSGLEEIIQFETIHQRKNGTFYYVDVHLQLTTFLFKPAYVAIILDVTKRKEIENRLNLVIQGADLGYWDWDYVTGKHQVNDRWLEILGLGRDQLDNYVDDWANRIHPDDKESVHEKIEHSIAYKTPYTVEFRMRHNLGHWVWVQGSGSVVEYDIDNKSPLRLCGTHQDISVRKQKSEQIRKLSRAVEQSPNLIFITDIKGIIEYINPKVYETTGYTAAEVIGKYSHIFSSGKNTAKEYKVLWESIKSGDEWKGTLLNKKKNGELYWAQESIVPIKNDNQLITHIITTLEDVSEAKKTSELLNYQASHDPLTGLINRRKFENRLNRIIDTSKQNNSIHVLCYLDLDQFKIINDTCTHVAGDELLKQFANILETTFRQRDSIGRLGGDEFAVLLEHCSIQQAESHANQLLDTVNNYQFHWDNKSFRVGVSIGIVAITNTIPNMSTILTRADVSCYAAKHAGRNRIHIYQESDGELARGHKELQWISRINQALNEDLFVLYAQPINQIGSNISDTKHYEVLIRLKDSNGDIIPPGAFLPAVERFNLSLQLDQWVINSTFKWLHQTKQLNNQVPYLSINLSGQNLCNSQLLAFIKKQHDQYPNISAENICFEITETAAINNLTDAREFITELKAYNFTFSLDDFGSGLSSFDYLKNLPVDYLKIDGQFIKNICNDPIDLALVKSINDIGHVMGKKTIAEFVENEEIMNLLTTLNVDYAQGYYIGKPESIDSITLPVKSNK